MRKDFTPDNVELWISNWKRKHLISEFVREWLNTFPFEKINVITNHSSVIIDDFDNDVKPLVKIWNNVMRHDDSIGPMSKNYNQAYVHTFLSGRKYCICAHDNMCIKNGWDDIIKNTDYDLYMAPQGDQVHLITLSGLQRFGWWDERYATNGNHELDYIARALRTDIFRYIHNNEQYMASLVDCHGWHDWPDDLIFNTQLAGDITIKLPIITGHPEIPILPTLSHNSVSLEKYWIRANKNEVPQTGPKSDEFNMLEWNQKKWHGNPQLFENWSRGPYEDEIDWYPWLNLYNLNVDICGIE